MVEQSPASHAQAYQRQVQSIFSLISRFERGPRDHEIERHERSARRSAQRCPQGSLHASWVHLWTDLHDGRTCGGRSGWVLRAPMRIAMGLCMLAALCCLLRPQITPGCKDRGPRNAPLQKATGQIFRGTRFEEQNPYSQHLYISTPFAPTCPLWSSPETTSTDLREGPTPHALHLLQRESLMPSHAMLRDVLVTQDRLSDDGAADPVLVRVCRWSTTFLPVLRVSSGPSPVVSPLVLDVQRNVPA